MKLLKFMLTWLLMIIMAIFMPVLMLMKYKVTVEAERQ
jgi:hypothetical protein